MLGAPLLRSPKMLRTSDHARPTAQNTGLIFNERELKGTKGAAQLWSFGVPRQRSKKPLKASFFSIVP